MSYNNKRNKLRDSWLKKNKIESDIKNKKSKDKSITLNPSLLKNYKIIEESDWTLLSNTVNSSKDTAVNGGLMPSTVSFDFEKIIDFKNTNLKKYRLSNIDVKVYFKSNNPTTKLYLSTSSDLFNTKDYDSGVLKAYGNGILAFDAPYYSAQESSLYTQQYVDQGWIKHYTYVPEEDKYRGFWTSKKERWLAFDFEESPYIMPDDYVGIEGENADELNVHVERNPNDEGKQTHDTSLPGNIISTNYNITSLKESSRIKINYNSSTPIVAKATKKQADKTIYFQDDYYKYNEDSPYRITISENRSEEELYSYYVPSIDEIKAKYIIYYKPNINYNEIRKYKK